LESRFTMRPTAVGRDRSRPEGRSYKDLPAHGRAHCVDGCPVIAGMGSKVFSTSGLASTCGT
jgi:hypothetical protein